MQWIISPNLLVKAMKRIPKPHFAVFTMFLTVLGYKSKPNSDGSVLCICPKMPKERRQIVIWRNGKMNKACELLWLDFLNHWLIIGKEFIDALNKKMEMV